MENKKLVWIVSIIVIVFLAVALLFVQQQKLSGMEEKSGRLILNNPEIQITQNEVTEYPVYTDGSMAADCCTEGWQRIRLDSMVSGDQGRVCLFAHPRTNGTVSLTYKNIKVKRAISFATAFSDAVATGNNAPVFMDVYVNNTLVQRITQLDNRGWNITEVSTEQYQNKLSDVKLVISTDNDFQRHFCFDAQTVE